MLARDGHEAWEVYQSSGPDLVISDCKKIRDEKESWLPLETYIARRTDARFTHGICPDCYVEVTLPMAEETRRRLQQNAP